MIVPGDLVCPNGVTYLTLFRSFESPGGEVTGGCDWDDVMLVLAMSSGKSLLLNHRMQLGWCWDDWIELA